MVVVNNVVVMVVRVVLWGCWSPRLLLLVPLLLLLHEVELVVPLAVQTIPLPLFTVAFPLPFALLTVCPGLLPFPFASRFLGGWDPFINNGDDPRARHPSVCRFQHPVDVDGGYRSRMSEIVRVGQGRIRGKLSITLPLPFPIAFPVAFPIPVTSTVTRNRVLLVRLRLIVGIVRNGR